jgi:hypothetical protein
MNHIQNFETFNESRLSNIIGGSLLVISSLGSPSTAKAMDDSLKVSWYKDRVDVKKEGSDSAKFNLFLFRRDGQMVRSQVDTNVMLLSNLDSGSYFLEVSDEENKKHYRFPVKVEN